MKRETLIWDGLVRLFHLLFAVGFALAFWIAKGMGEDSTAFPFHMMLGLSLAFMVILRIVWLFVGTKWARFQGVDLNPMRLISYFGSVLNPKSKDSPGHNPATSWAMALMVVLTLFLAFSGLRMSQGDESLKGLHEAASFLFVGTAAAHVCGVLIHTLVKRDALPLAMVDGRKAVDPADGLPKGAPIAATLFLIASSFFFGSLAANWNPATGTTRWPLTGGVLALGESEGEEQDGEGGGVVEPEAGEREEHEEDDD